MFTFCLFMFWLHTVVLVVLSKTRKLQFTNRVNLSSLFILRRHYLHILTAFYPFHKSLADIIILWLLKLGIKLLIHNKDDIQFVTEFPCFLGTHCRCRYKKTICKTDKKYNPFNDVCKLPQPWSFEIPLQTRHLGVFTENSLDSFC